MGNVVGNFVTVAVAVAAVYISIGTSPTIQDWLGLSDQVDNLSSQGGEKYDYIVGRKSFLSIFKVGTHFQVYSLPL